MSEPFIGEIIMFGGTFAPRGWALCDGQLLAISSNSALFSILGTTFGGDGRTTFGLPGCRGRAGTGIGTGPGLNEIRLGQRGGANTHTITRQEMPQHKHTITPRCNTNTGNNPDPAGGYPANLGANLFYSNTSDDTMGQSTTANTGASQPISITQPYLAINYIIALVGIYPSRS